MNKSLNSRELEYSEVTVTIDQENDDHCDLKNNCLIG